MTIRELALRRVQGCGMSPREAELMLEEFARTQQGSIIGWDDIAPGLSRSQVDIIDRAALGYRTRSNLKPDPKREERAMPDSTLIVYAWVGEDEHGSGVVGLKQALTPAGMIPLAAMGHHLDRLDKMLPAMEAQAVRYGKKIRLVKFAAAEVVIETEAGK